MGYWQQLLNFNFKTKHSIEAIKIKIIHNYLVHTAFHTKIPIQYFYLLRMFHIKLQTLNMRLYDVYINHNIDPTSQIITNYELNEVTYELDTLCEELYKYSYFYDCV